MSKLVSGRSALKATRERGNITHTKRGNPCGKYSRRVLAFVDFSHCGIYFRPMRTYRLLPLIALLLALFTSCSAKLSQRTDLTDADLFAMGTRATASRSWADASEAFQTLLDRFPNSPFSARAQFALAEARMADGEDAEAESAFNDFLRLHPGDPRAPEALYRKAELLERQTAVAGRDQGKTQEAIDAYRLVLARDPDGSYVAKATDRIVALRARLALHEEGVVSHYIKRKKFDSAIARARRALADFPEAANRPALLSLLADALERDGKSDEAAKVRESVPSNGGKIK